VKDSSTATERVGRYQLLEPIGGGPNGIVSRAKVFGVAGFERQFAVKRFMPELTAGAIAQALSAAARSYGSLEHPRIARMSEFGVAQGQTFTAVEYVAGLDAFRLMQEAKLSGAGIAAGGALALVSQAARAVGYAHGRGLSHLGLSPSNVIVTADGDVKVTDFGILAATMPPRPVEVQRLAQRIPYLAPEQLSGEATSAATDVFVLGVIAYELVTGQRAYRGDTPAQIAQAIQAGPPAEPPLPRPIVRVLQRCLARSPFERFPDARALADALDAALRVAPVPGTRKDIGAQIKSTLDRNASMNEGNLSGMVALNLQTAQAMQAAGAQAEPVDVATMPFPRDQMRTEPSPIVPDSTYRDLPKAAFNTVPGLAPPPIPVPPGVTPPPSPPTSAAAGAPKTMLGLALPKKPQIPSIVPPKNGPPTPPPRARTTPPPMPAVQPDVIEEPSGLIEIDDVAPLVAAQPSVSGVMPAQDPPTMQGVAAPSKGPAPKVGKITKEWDEPPPQTGPTVTAKPGNITMGWDVPPEDMVAATHPAAARLPSVPPSQNFESSTGEMSPHQVEEFTRRSVQQTSEIVTARPDPASIAAFENDARAVAGELVQPPMHPSPPIDQPTPIVREQTVPARMQQAPVVQVPPRKRGSKAPIVIISMLAIGGLAAAGWYAYTTMYKKSETETVAASGSSSAVKPVDTHPVAVPPEKGSATAPPDKGSATPDKATPDKATPDKGSATPDKATPDKATPDKGSATPDKATPDKATPDKGSATPDKAAPDKATPDKGSAADQGSPDKKPDKVKATSSSSSLEIKSKPEGARVFIDGADQGTSPVKLPGSSDRHTMVILQPGHELYIGEVDGHGVFDVTLKPVTPSGGHAGIKVIKCKAKERYYVYVDGKATGMTCPTERIDTVVGPHTVEVYDIVTDSRRKWDITVKDERLSARVRIDD